MRIYIAGPMSGYPEYNFPAFDAARDHLIDLGHVPINPADLDRAIGYDPTSPLAVHHIPIDARFTEFAIRRDVDSILQCDAILLLPGWEKSRGATGEKHIAEWARKHIFYPGDEIPHGDLPHFHLQAS